MTDYTKLLDLCSSPSYMKHNLCSLPLHKKYRGHFEIIALSLEATRDNGATAFSIMKHASINYSQLKKYLHSLIEIGFITVNREKDQCFYRTTEKGIDFLREYYVLLGMLLSAFEKNKPASTVYEGAYEAATVKQQPAPQLVASLQHKH
jgi:predicted transcriptional regulator